jgi:radical SAM superfamily enzyme YgiQ (UPF0313 family)
LTKIKPKIVIASMPFVDDDSMLAAPAVLKASLNKHGFDCVGLDLNIEIYNKIHNHPNRNLFLNFFYNQDINDNIAEELVQMLEFYAQEILEHNPSIIGLSLFSHNSQTFTAWLCAVLKQYSPSSKIVIGGPGLQTLENSFFKFPDRLKQLGFIDDYITGDGEISLVEYAKGNLNYPGINSTNWQPLTEFNKMPIPDFSDYRFFRYHHPILPIIDSRGCVQTCEFCDVIAFWKKFQYLTANEIYAQMIEHIKNYKIYRFQFGSSISNGNFREFKKLVKLISNYNKNIAVNVNDQIHWLGSFIIRPATHHKEELFRLIKESNGFLFCGVESIISTVRHQLGKKFTNEDLEHHLIMCQKYQIPMNLLLIAAYPTETKDDYEYTKQWFIEHKQFANNTINQVQLTLPTILPGTQLEKNMKFKNFSQTSNIRIKHANNLMVTIKECGFNLRSFV